MGYGEKIRLGDSFDGDSTLSTSVTFSDEITADGQLVEIQIEVTGSGGDTDSVEVTQYNSISPSNGQFETIGKTLGSITLNGATKVISSFQCYTARIFKIGLNMIAGSSETPSYQGYYSINSEISNDKFSEAVTEVETVDVSGSLILKDTINSVDGIIYKESIHFIHNYHHPTGDSAIPEGNNIFIGENAGNFTMGSNATATTQSSNNIGIGSDVLIANTLGDDNIGIGSSCLNKNTTGLNNIGIGKSALEENIGGRSNVAVGLLAMQNNTEGDDCCAVGQLALTANTTGAQNCAFGAESLELNNDGDGNICIGFRAGDNITSGSYNIIIGNNIDAPSASSNYELNIGNFIKGTYSDAEFQIFKDTSTTNRQLFEISNDWSVSADATREGLTVFKISDYNSDGGRSFMTARANGTEAEIGFFGLSTQVQQAHIVDADGTLGDITTKFNTLLADLEGYGLLKTS